MVLVLNCFSRWRLMQDLLERDKDGDVSGDVMICSDKAPCLSSRSADLESQWITQMGPEASSLFTIKEILST